MTYVTGRQRTERRKRKAKRAAFAFGAMAIVSMVFFCVIKWPYSERNRKIAAGLNVPAFSGQPYAEVNGNIPFFQETDYNTKSFEQYSDLDGLGRCGAACANVGRDLMPTEERGEIDSIKPTGWIQEKYEGMLPFEERVAKYLDQNDNHVLYRVTPVFEGSNLLASGVLMEAYSVEDHGAGISFCVYCYNVQSGIKIDYRTGKSSVEQ